MKKLFILILACLLLVAPLTACQDAGNTPPPADDEYWDDSKYLEDTKYPDDKEDPNGGTKPGGEIVTLPEGMSGTEAIRLMLANERLNSQLLKDSENIFNTGSQVFQELAAKAKENLVKNTYVSDNKTVSLSAFTTLSTKVEAGDGSYVEIDGNRYVWKSFTEYSNSYSYFEGLTSAVVSNAESGARLIDDVKQRVRVVDKWVDVGYGAYYLHVEEDMELLLFRDGGTSPQDSACRRYKNENGDNVYEVYIKNEICESRMIYIPGKKCEYSFEPVGEEFANHDFLAENTKGFWEVVDVSRMPTHYNVSCMVLKDDICYDAFYEPAEDRRGINMLKVISADKKTDILWYAPESNSTLIYLHLQGFDGVDYMELVDDTVDKSGVYHDTQSDGKDVYTPGSLRPTLVTTKGV
ncbi:MAG: hypothetical protein IJX62_09205, partial [Clostridia bacterium]|nr:hypothetical protein [Clostridia bacterium]